ncbi:Ataxin-10 [Galemys pyrenaicus]|uniref:Ataxin-10 n=1 Tax=Galemys pyrenaicus TaxID=202257 RepID=A0A8J6AFR0_GALPY|nr:Ataxin-10 [Galemys pyrenaicus]
MGDLSLKGTQALTSAGDVGPRLNAVCEGPEGAQPPAPRQRPWAPPEHQRCRSGRDFPILAEQLWPLDTHEGARPSVRGISSPASPRCDGKMAAPRPAPARLSGVMVPAPIPDLEALRALTALFKEPRNR